MKYLNYYESLSYSGGDVTKMPIIGKIITNPVGSFESAEYNVVEIIKDNNDRDIYVINQWYKEGRVPNLIHSLLVKEFISGVITETSATGGPFIGGGMGYPSSSGGLGGQNIGLNWSTCKNTKPDEIAVPYNPSGANRIFQKIPMRKTRSHGSNRDKKIKPFKDILFKRKQDFTKGEGDSPKVMSYQNFQKDDITKIKKDESIATTIGALGLAASSILHPSKPKEIPSKDPVKDKMTMVEQTKDDVIKQFVDSIIEKYPSIVGEINEFTLPISVLENEFLTFKEFKKISDLSLRDLDLLSKPHFPLQINYFVSRGLDIDNKPTFIPILNVNYTNVIKLHGHNIEFNFTRVTGVNTIGAKINF